MPLFLFLLLLAENTTSEVSPPIQPSFENEIVLHIGDSQARGPFGYHLGRLVTTEGHATSYEVHGEIGKGIDWWMARNRITRIIQQVRPTIIIVSLGGNDARQFQNQPEQYRTKLSQFIQVLADNADLVIWNTPPVATKGNAYLQPARDAITEELFSQQEHNSKLIVIDTRENPANYDSSLRTGDGIHFTYQGGRTWAEYCFVVYEAIMAEITSKKKKKREEEQGETINDE